jgi:hypothetical protein
VNPQVTISDQPGWVKVIGMAYYKFTRSAEQGELKSRVQVPDLRLRGEIMGLIMISTD